MRSLALIVVSLIVACHQFDDTQAAPMKFMCDMCESNWLHCIMKCHMEQYMTRHEYNSNNVYMGTPEVRPKKTHLDHMFEHYMHQTGHNHDQEPEFVLVLHIFVIPLVVPSKL
eukprot:maker-scaffold338_size202645-snap-gene-1.19 protein:Tk00726 transcript:maker-scaffold338_size202645-snap-gene-1.19-mRNA-1 annotation:"voltage-dependent l-type calcium channel subunit alpha-1d isoform 1"